MRFLLMIFAVFVIVNAQFASFGNIANTLHKGINNIATRANSVPLLNNVKNFADFAAQTGKTYASEADRKIRENIFISRKNLVDNGNAAFSSGLRSYELTLNAFADLTNAEFLTKLTGNKKSAQGNENAKKHRQIAEQHTFVNIPDSFDWREKGGVTPVKFQGDCGSCWSFAVTGAIEGHIFRKSGTLENLSEQNLIDCGNKEFGLDGCNGGFQEYGFEFITNQNGIANGERYPYLDRKDTCKYKSTLKSAAIKGFAVINSEDEDTMKKVVATMGPLACSINGLESLLLYKRGIYADEECNKGEVNHSVLVVGYGSEGDQDYWIVKNSWDKNWGENGYFRLPRGSNFCKIATECSYPVI